MEKINTAVFVSGGGTNLEHLILSSKKGIMPHVDIKFVLSNKKDAYALTRAKNHNIPSYVSKDVSYILNLLKENNIRLIVLAGYLAILSSEFISNFERELNGKIINIHPSLIPSFCGKGYYGIKVHQKALEYGVKVSGASVHFVNEIPDGGKIIMQKAVKVKDDDTPESLQKRIMRLAEWKILPLASEKVAKMLLGEK